MRYKSHGKNISFKANITIQGFSRLLCRLNLKFWSPWFNYRELGLGWLDTRDLKGDGSILDISGF